MGTPPFLYLDCQTFVWYTLSRRSPDREHSKWRWKNGTNLWRLCTSEAFLYGHYPKAARLGLSPVYMSNIETDRKPAPTQEYLEKLAQELHLNVDERRYLLDLAAKSKEQCVSADLPEYIMERDIVRAALRTAKEVDATDEEWQAFIDRLTQRDKDQKGG